MTFHHRITFAPDRRSGQPCIRGMRITVKDILEYLAGGMTQEQILEDFPELEPEYTCHRPSVEETPYQNDSWRSCPES